MACVKNPGVLKYGLGICSQEQPWHALKPSVLNYGLGICSEKPKQMLKPGLFKYGRGMCSEEQPWHILNSFCTRRTVHLQPRYMFKWNSRRKQT